MKKHLYLFATAAVALASCSNDEQIAQNSTAALGNQPKEITLSPLAQKATRTAITTGPVSDAVYPDNLVMQVAAYAFPPTSTTWTGSGYFDKTPFDGTGSNWVGDPKRYWPLTDAYVTFLAVAGVTAENVSFTASTFASGGTATYNADTNSDNIADNSDLMYSGKQEHVAQNGNSLTYPDDVDMVFKHALSWLQFNVKAANASYANKIHVTGIVINSANTQGTFTIDNAGYATIGNPNPSGTWGSLTTNNIGVYAATADKTLTSTFEEYGSALIIPKGAEQTSFTNFTIYYTLDGKAYTFNYTPASTELLQANKYIYNITFTLTEIIIDPAVQTWTDGGTTSIDIPTLAIGTSATYNQPAYEGTYTLAITGLEGTTAPTCDATGSSTAMTTIPTATDPTTGVTTVSYTIPANTADGAERTFSFTVTDNGTGGSNKVSTITITQAAGPDYVAAP